ncbi:exonuclease SbcCD subunit D C-terminal domain-containing protein [Vitreoscilla stercoraria]|uniref:Nuclease SbcCD subunit D n=1 Tax=Vitreoscilla stercoraria TaxID=61 RepID=A0ABY4EBT7_VITST|nr:exonuclease SbcCD subunit D C-terminal domain-containing protein [Vitreoscilla stercoraria]UOO92912.1 exonuclease SbcCD subunit D C-terminal domain-containing protein [Vitreoscilla stercoraria]
MLHILHTSDWHLGRQLYGQNRHAEFQAFLQWLQQTMQAQHTDVLLIAGDVFDTITPNHAAQELYYQFLAHCAAENLCQHIVIIGGNHDSASFLNAPKSLLSALNVTVIGAATEHLEDEVLVLRHTDHTPMAIVCAVPYLRDRDVRLNLENQSIDNKQQALLQGIRQHYQNIYLHAQNIREQLAADIPIIAMGHLFTQGGVTIDADGVRELYVGTLAHIGVDVFAGFDYVALGHLHVPQTVAKTEHIRYCGSPIAMGFGEAGQQKQVVSVTFTGRSPQIHCIDIPVFHVLKRITGNEASLRQQLQYLIAQAQPIYIEAVYQGNEMVADLSQQLHDLVKNSVVTILRVHNRQFIHQVLPHQTEVYALPDLTPEEVFDACLQQHDIADTEKTALRLSHQQVLQQIQQQDADS